MVSHCYLLSVLNYPGSMSSPNHVMDTVKWDPLMVKSALGRLWTRIFVIPFPVIHCYKVVPSFKSHVIVDTTTISFRLDFRFSDTHIYKRIPERFCRYCLNNHRNKLVVYFPTVFSSTISYQK